MAFEHSIYPTKDQFGDASEFGGVGGIIQPGPHTPDASESLHLVYSTDSADNDPYGEELPGTLR